MPSVQCCPAPEPPSLPAVTVMIRATILMTATIANTHTTPSYVPDTTQSHRSLLQALAIHGHANPPSNCLQQLLSVVQAHMQRKWDLWG